MNPAAGRGIGKKFIALLHKYLQGRGIAYEIVPTLGPGDATEIARLSPNSNVVAVGGDGTINEVANGLVGTGKTLGIIPAGSGNDFSKSMQIPTKLATSIEKLLEGKTRTIDVGTVVCSSTMNGEPEAGNSSPRYFVNGVGIGFDAAVAERTARIKHFSGTALYILAVLQTLGKYTSPNFHLSVDTVSLSSKRLLIAVGNGRCVGGGFYLTPEARVDDGLLDVCTIDEMPLIRILGIMPRVMKGNHQGISGVSFFRGRKITVTGDSGYYVHADGEIVGRETRRVNIGLLEKALTVIGG